MQQDFELTTVYVSVPVYLVAALIATVAYSIWYVATAIRHHRKIGAWFWRSSARPALLAVLPLLANTPVVWFGFERVVRAMSVSGGGRAALSAGVAEALVPLSLGTAMSGVIAAFGTVFAPLRLRLDRSSQQQLENVPPRSIKLPLVFGLLAGAGVLATCRFAARLFESAKFARAYEQAAIVGLVLSSAVAVAALITSLSPARTRKRIEVRGGGHTTSLCLIAIISILSSIGAWRAIGFYRRVALGLLSAATLFTGAGKPA